MYWFLNLMSHSVLSCYIAQYRRGGKKALIRAINAITPVLPPHEEWQRMIAFDNMEVKKTKRQAKYYELNDINFITIWESCHRDMPHLFLQSIILCNKGVVNSSLWV